MKTDLQDTTEILLKVALREYDTVARADNYFAEYRMLFLRRRGNERDIFEIALDGTSLFRGSCIDVIKSRLRKNLKAPASSRIMPFLKGETNNLIFLCVLTPAFFLSP